MEPTILSAWHVSPEHSVLRATGKPSRLSMKFAPSRHATPTGLSAPHARAAERRVPPPIPSRHSRADSLRFNASTLHASTLPNSTTQRSGRRERSGVSWRGQLLRFTAPPRRRALGKSATANPGNRRPGDSAELALINGESFSFAQAPANSQRDGLKKTRARLTASRAKSSASSQDYTRFTP